MFKIDYSLNVNPLGVPKSFKKNVQKSLDKLCGRHEEKEKSALKAIAGYHQITKKNIVIGSGGSELLHLAVKTLRPSKALVAFPSTPLYAKACKDNGCDVVPYILDGRQDFDADFESFAVAASVGVDMVILSNPNNPTGRIIPKHVLMKILDYCQEKGIYVILDEEYADFVSADISAIKYISRYANIIILRTLANYFSLKGLRFAYAIASDSLADVLRMNRMPRTMGYLPLMAFETLFGDLKYIKKTKMWLLSEPKRFYHMISTVGGVRAYKPFANYIFIELQQIPAAILCERLKNKGITVRNCSKFGVPEGGQYIRISIKDKKSNEKFLDKFSRCLL